jgi:hypothetical protein
MRAGDDVEPAAIWGARAFLVGTALFVVQLVVLGLEWQWALLYTAGTVVIYAAQSRVVAETGAFFIHPGTLAGIVLWTFFGAQVLGPQNMLLMFVVSSVFMIVPREALMPFVVHALRIADRRGARPGPVAGFGAAALAVGLAVAIPVTLYIQYDRGASSVSDGWTRHIPRIAYNSAVRVRDRLDAQGTLDQTERTSSLSRLGAISPDWGAVASFFIAAGLVIAFTVCRLRFARWPFHPIMFIMLGSYHGRSLAVSFLIGCLAKVLATKYGGAASYHRLKPAMVGLIAGDMIGGLVPILIGALYYHVTGEVPGSFRVLPG